MKIPSDVAVKLRKLDRAKEADWIALVKAIGEDPKAFFRFSDWSGADFSMSNMQDVSWEGAIIDGARFRAGDLTDEAKASAKSAIGVQEVSVATVTSEDQRKRMIRQFELIELVQSYNPDVDEALLNKAYVYGMQKHGTQQLSSGAPYFTRPLDVAAILADNKLDESTISASLIMDTISPNTSNSDEVDNVFGKDISNIVNGIRSVNDIMRLKKGVTYADELKSVLSSASDDIRVLIIVLARQLSIISSADDKPKERRRAARRAIDFYAPLARGLGMHSLGGQLEDAAYITLQPRKYKIIRDKLSAVESSASSHVNGIISEITKLLERKNISAKVSWIRGEPWKYMRRALENNDQGIKIERKQKLLILVSTIEECYSVLGVIHSNWKFVTGLINDYISVPKQNDYRAIHTTVIFPRGERIEIQIRTQEMNEIAECGVAAFIDYDERFDPTIERLKRDSQAYTWLRGIIENMPEVGSDEDMLSYAKMELNEERIVCYTPRGRLVMLAKGATPLDYAYAIHRELGDACVGAKINGSIAPLDSKLKDGDEVEIMTDENHRHPEKWKEIVATGRAWAAIRNTLRPSADKPINKREKK